MAVSRNRRGLDWPLFRRRLLIWATTLPVQQLVDPQATYGALVAALGPLADAQTHGLRRVSRTPWQPAQQVRIWQAALRGPLTWLAAIGWTEGADATRWCFAPAEQSMAGAAPQHDPASERGWQAGPVGTVQIPHPASQRDVLALLPYARWHASDATHTTYQIATQSLAAATRRGYARSSLRALCVNAIPGLASIRLLSAA